MSNKLVSQLASCNLKIAAFEMMKTFSEGVYKQELVAALDLFSKLPCAETVVNLIHVFPEAASVMTLADDSFVRMTPKEILGPRFERLEDWMSSFDRNLKTVAVIQSYLLKEASVGNVTVGFHSMRDQAILFERLERIGIKKGFFSNKRQFLRDRITKDASAFRSVIDLICIHGVHTGRERFWDTLGNEVDPQFHLHSEIQYNLSLNVESFLSILAGIELNEKEG
jgi:hypothetical protein